MTAPVTPTAWASAPAGLVGCALRDSRGRWVLPPRRGLRLGPLRHRRRVLRPAAGGCGMRRPDCACASAIRATSKSAGRTTLRTSGLGRRVHDRCGLLQGLLQRRPLRRVARRSVPVRLLPVVVLLRRGHVRRQEARRVAVRGPMPAPPGYCAIGTCRRERPHVAAATRTAPARGWCNAAAAARRTRTPNGAPHRRRRLLRRVVHRRPLPLYIGPETETTAPSLCCSGAATEYTDCNDPKLRQPLLHLQSATRAAPAPSAATAAPASAPTPAATATRGSATASRSAVEAAATPPTATSPAPRPPA